MFPPRLHARGLAEIYEITGDNQQLLGLVPGYKLHGRRFAFPDFFSFFYFFFSRRWSSFAKSASTRQSALATARSRVNRERGDA